MRNTEPTSLQEAIVYFSNPDNCTAYLVERRWPDGVVTCPTCGSDNVTFQPKRRLFQCKECRPKGQFSVKVGTIMEDSPIGLDKWLCAMWMLSNCKNGVSSWEIHRAIKVTQKSAWFMLQRIRLALQDDNSGGQLSGHVEVDETFIGGKARNMHKTALARRVAQFATPRTGRNQTTGKVAVMGLLQRHGEVRTMVVPNTKRASLQGEVYRHVEQGSTVYSDALRSYSNLENDFTHKVINHAEKYVDGQIHTNSLENFWSCLKRTIGGTYISVEPFHLFRYLDEQSFRFNNRKTTDANRFDLAVSQIVGKRLTYAEVTGKDKDARKLSH
ncbi:MAG TPA: IS1595 family transposase [Blastocatellia bacterium]|nr:IS1595 family transposase [Blastocatellia bacterium]